MRACEKEYSQDEACYFQLMQRTEKELQGSQSISGTKLLKIWEDVVESSKSGMLEMSHKESFIFALDFGMDNKEWPQTAAADC